MLAAHGLPSRDWWEDTPNLPDGVDLSLSGLLSHWDAIETDFHHFYGIDLKGGVLGRRRWGWFMKRLTRLLAEDTALARAVGLRGADHTAKAESMGADS